jgi:superfamily II DNA helicase RecQ
MLWGQDGIMIYNDAYSVFAGGRHPKLLGSKVREGWPEVADFSDHVMKVGLLVVQKTGLGKSFVYFISIELLRENGDGPALLISPLLALMRNQIAAAERVGVRAATINSDNYLRCRANILCCVAIE